MSEYDETPDDGPGVEDDSAVSYRWADLDADAANAVGAGVGALARLGDLARWGECSHTTVDGCAYVAATVVEDVDGLAGVVYDDILGRGPACD